MSWDYHFDPQTNVIDVHISRLRSKIDKGFETAAAPHDPRRGIHDRDAFGKLIEPGVSSDPGLPVFVRRCLPPSLLGYLLEHPPSDHRTDHQHRGRRDRGGQRHLPTVAA